MNFSLYLEYEKTWEKKWEKSQIIYKTIDFLKPARELGLQGIQVNRNPQDDKILQGQTEHRNFHTFGRTLEGEVAAIKAGKTQIPNVLMNS